MAFINDNYQKLPGSYLFSEIAKRVAKFQSDNPNTKIIRLGIGDVTQPLPKVCIDAMKHAVDEMGNAKTFRGYGPEQGYDFLREKIADFNYKRRGLNVEANEIFISDGSKCDCGNIQEIFSINSKIAIADPVYPVYLDTNVMAGRTGSLQSDGHFEGVDYLPCTAQNNFSPSIPNEHVDLIYLCSPNNPTGTTLSKEALKEWVDYAKANNSIILYDAAYAAYITEDDVPRSIYEVDGARDCAIEFRSFSKNAGFTGVRLGFTVIPKDLKAGDTPLHPLWARRHGTKYNGAPYIIQRAGEAVYSDEGRAQLKQQVAYYMNNAKYIYNGLKEAGYTVSGGVNAPYVWVRTPGNMTSWEFFDYLLDKANVVGTPGSGFGPSGEHYFRVNAFGSYENTVEAIERIKAL